MGFSVTFISHPFGLKVSFIKPMSIIFNLKNFQGKNIKNQ